VLPRMLSLPISPVSDTPATALPAAGGEVPGAGGRPPEILCRLHPTSSRAACMGQWTSQVNWQMTQVVQCCKAGGYCNAQLHALAATWPLLFPWPPHLEQLKLQLKLHHSGVDSAKGSCLQA
jgi:hypothetical protein